MPGHNRSDGLRTIIPVGLLLLLPAGCPGPKSGPGGATAAAPPAGVKLRLAVLDDSPLADAAARLQGEWKALTGCRYQVEPMTEKELADAELLEPDAVICPSHQLGPLAERKLIVPMPKELSETDAGDWSDLFELVQLRVAAWGKDVYAVPFGSAVFTCYYRADLLRQLGAKPPESWAQYQQLAERLADRAESGNASKAETQTNHAGPRQTDSWCGTIEPLAPGWAGLVLLARAAAYAKHRDNYSTLFDIQTMEPLVAGPPFVRALEELIAAARVGPAEPADYDPAAVRKAFWQGRCAMALSWPTAAAKDLRASQLVEAGFVELPGSMEVFDVGKQRWEPRADDDPRVPLLAVAGRIGVVSTGSAYPKLAFELLLWLSGKEFGPQVSATSPATTLFRRSHVESPRKWVEKPIPPAAADQYAAMTAATLKRPQWLFAPRIPGRSEYLSALDEAVHQAVLQQKPPAEALTQAATRWREITNRLGREEQRQAYWHSLGLD